jgi:hypothetical protein
MRRVALTKWPQDFARVYILLMELLIRLIRTSTPTQPYGKLVSQRTCREVNHRRAPAAHASRETGRADFMIIGWG